MADLLAQFRQLPLMRFLLPDTDCIQFAPDFRFFFRAPLFLTDVSQTVQHVFTVIDIGDREARAQQRFGVGGIPARWFPERITIRPADPAPAPLRIRCQPGLEQRIRARAVAQFKMRFGDCAAESMGRQVVFIRKPPQQFLADRDAFMQE
ncbi:MAG: hypothetical protein ACKV2V_29635 [Blastocatellia bacterium]